MSDLVGNLEDWFSRDAAHLLNCRRFFLRLKVVHLVSASHFSIFSVYLFYLRNRSAQVHELLSYDSLFGVSCKEDQIMSA